MHPLHVPRWGQLLRPPCHSPVRRRQLHRANRFENLEPGSYLKTRAISTSFLMLHSCALFVLPADSFKASVRTTTMATASIPPVALFPILSFPAWPGTSTWRQEHVADMHGEASFECCICRQLLVHIGYLYSHNVISFMPAQLFSCWHLRDVCT